MDLNELPPELDYDFLDDQDANPSYCTQAVVGEQGPVHGIVQVLEPQNSGDFYSGEVAIVKQRGKSKSLCLVSHVGSLKNDAGLKRQFKLKC